MNSHKKKHKQKKRNSIFRKWHRRIGFAASLFLANLAISGLLLNHYEKLSLHQQTISSGWLLDWYGITAPEAAICFVSQTKNSDDTQQQICQLDDHLYLNNQFWKNQTGKLLGLMTFEDGFIIATNRYLYYLSETHQLIDQISLASAFEQPVSGFYKQGTYPLVAFASDAYLLDIDTLQWQKSDNNQAREIPKRLTLEQSNLQKIQTDYRQRQISYLQFVQDLHSGRVLGLSGTIINDITAILLLLLAITGTITWWRRKNKN